MLRVLFILIIVLWPNVHVWFSKRVSGNQKFIWATIVLLTSWIGYLFFLIKTRSPDE